MTRPGNWGVEKRAYLARRSNHWLLKQGVGWTGEGVLMSLKIFLNKAPTLRLPKNLKSTSRLSQSSGNWTDKGMSCCMQFSGASYWASKRKETTSMSCETAELYQLSGMMDETMINSIENCWIRVWSVMDLCVLYHSFSSDLINFEVIKKIYHPSKYHTVIGDRSSYAEMRQLWFFFKQMINLAESNVQLVV